MTIDTIMNPQTPTSEQKKATFLMVAAMAEAIRGLGTVPSGHLYAMVMGKVDLAGFERIIQTLVNAGLVDNKSNELRWIGPTLEAA